MSMLNGRTMQQARTSAHTSKKLTYAKEKRELASAQCAQQTRSEVGSGLNLRTPSDTRPSSAHLGHPASVSRLTLSSVKRTYGRTGKKPTLVTETSRSFDTVDDGSVSLDYDEYASKPQNKRRVPSLIVGPPAVACLSNNEASSSRKPTVLIEVSQRVPSLSPSSSNVKGTRVERSLASTNKSSKSNQQHRNSSNENYQNKTNSFFTDEELLELDKFGLPDPVTPENIRIITNRLHEAYHEEKIVTLNLDELPPSFFTVLLKPTGKDGEAPVRHHKLVCQYDVSRHFPGDRRFKHLLLSPRGLLMHVGDCQQKSDCCCSPQLNICVASGCLQALRREKCPKFAIAQGNWIGQLPPHLSNMAYGTLALLRPIKSFGRMVSYSSSTSPTGGTRLTGHLYSTRLNTTLVRQRIPLEPRDAPVKALLVSPFASDKSASARAKIARTKQDYIIEPEKIKQMLQFWRDVDNIIMANIELDDACLDGLPRDDVSPAMFMIDDETLPTSDGETYDTEASNEVGIPSTERFGEIRATIWRENLNLWQQRLKVNKVYDVSNFKVLKSEQRYSSIRPGKYQINFDKWTKCDAVGDSDLIPNFPVLNWQLKTFSEIQTMNRYSEDVIIVDIFGLYIDCYLPGISENQQLVICNELGGKRVSIHRQDTAYSWPDSLTRANFGATSTT
ncbi:hypothetical protein DAPPUDRAFT_115765 [Daphnia pulex]|uniref:DUF6570 domain-containing protein n=1 Tax=Daphnia pulex TaxID=6669 RepID=E9HMF5_DAPPU|nr:hypothetical protein DAPPUDRAFT_115765 [Daphnia pulex]|eukprot:EFX67084.1 hypothetical protein DAPPUDRAFT_115765 [Daphnia pulex]